MRAIVIPSFNKIQFYLQFQYANVRYDTYLPTMRSKGIEQQHGRPVVYIKAKKRCTDNCPIRVLLCAAHTHTDTGRRGCSCSTPRISWCNWVLCDRVWCLTPMVVSTDPSFYFLFFFFTSYCSHWAQLYCFRHTFTFVKTSFHLWKICEKITKGMLLPIFGKCIEVRFYYFCVNMIITGLLLFQRTNDKDKEGETGINSRNTKLIEM